MRTIAKNISATKILTKSNSLKLHRAIGTTDIDGKGTVHPISSVDPIIFLDEAVIEGETSSAFNIHPHTGMIAVTYLLEGSTCATDNVNGDVQDELRTGGVYCINAGRGVTHGEKAALKSGRIRLLQLWYLPDIYNNALLKSSYQLFQPNEIPFFQNDVFSAKIIIGEAFGLASPVVSFWPMQYLHVIVKGFKAKNFSLPDKLWNGFIYIISGTGKFGANSIIASERACLVFDNEKSDTIFVQNKSIEDLEFILVTGKPHNKEFFKLLGHGGAIVARSETDVREKMIEYENDPINFGM